MAEFDQAFQRSSGVGHNFVLGGRPQRSGDVEYFVPGVPFTVPQQALLKNWHDIHGDIPPDLSFMAGAGDPETIQRNAERPGYASLGVIENIWRYSHVSYTILRSMGFESALGKDTQGRLEPIPVGKPRANPREGLGMTPSRPPRRPTEPSDKARAIVTDTGVVYGVLRRDELHVTCQLTSGLSRPTGESLEVDSEDLRQVVRWKGKIIGVAESTFPHPRGWRLGDLDVPLDKIDVKKLTYAFSVATRVPPSCLAAWAARIGPLPEDVGTRYNQRLLTPRDWASHFKNIMHRAMRVRSHDDRDPGCRCCRYARENIEHLATTWPHAT